MYLLYIALALMHMKPRNVQNYKKKVILPDSVSLPAKVFTDMRYQPEQSKR